MTKKIEFSLLNDVLTLLSIKRKTEKNQSDYRKTLNKRREVKGYENSSKNNMELKIHTSRENGLRQTGPHTVKSNKSNNGKISNRQKIFILK